MKNIVNTRRTRLAASVRSLVVGALRCAGALGMVAGAVALSACSGASAYRGDGRLVDAGVAAASRYVLDLGPVALDRAGVATYRIERLPVTAFVLGIGLTASAGAPALDSRPVTAVVTLELRGPEGTTVFRRTGPLSEWTWSLPVTGDSAFVYGRQEPATRFTPTAGRYTLTLTVHQPDAQARAYAPVLRATGGGWK